MPVYINRKKMIPFRFMTFEDEHDDDTSDSGAGPELSVMAQNVAPETP